MFKKLIVFIFLISMHGCAPINRQSKDWNDGYREGHKDGRWVGYKIRDFEMKLLEVENESY